MSFPQGRQGNEKLHTFSTHQNFYSSTVFHKTLVPKHGQNKIKKSFIPIIHSLTISNY